MFNYNSWLVYELLVAFGEILFVFTSDLSVLLLRGENLGNE